MPFSRLLPPDVIDRLQKEHLFVRQLKDDCLREQAFLAIRKDTIDFYHKGGRLFKYDTKHFHTHIKYASVIPRKGKDYLTEQELASGKHRLIDDFEKEYRRIKENCHLHAGVEALGVSYLYNQHSYLCNNNVVVLDIEVSFGAQESHRSQDRIDVLLFNKDTRTLQFVEAKHYSNKHLWSTTKPRVIEQIERYRNQIKAHKGQIIREYVRYIDYVNQLFSVSLPTPKHLEDDVTLLIFGFDKDQQKGRLTTNIRQNPHYKNIQLYTIGNIKRIVSNNMWKA